MVLQEESPFGALTAEELEARFTEESARAQREFPQKLDELEHQLASVDPRLTLSKFSFYALTTTRRRIAAREPEPAFHQHHVELLQALFLRRPLAKLSTLPPDDDAMTRITQLVMETTTDFHLRRLTPGDDPKAIERRQLELLRTHTLGFRNWGQPYQVKGILAGLFEPLENENEQRIGVRAHWLLDMLFEILRICEEKITNHRRRFSPVIGANGLSEGASQLLAVAPELARIAPHIEERVAEAARRSDDPLVLLAYADLFLPEVFTFTVDDFVRAYPGEVNPASLSRVLEQWSLSFGDSAEIDREHLFLANPVWLHPMVHLPDGAYFVPIVSLFQSFAIELLEAVIGEHASVRERYRLRRGKYLEQEVARMLGAALPEATLIRNASWNDPVSGANFETDLIVLLDGVLIIVECKSAQMSPEGRRGAAQTLREELRALLVAPSQQSRRLEQALQSSGELTVTGSNGEVADLKRDALHRVERLTVHLELLGLWAQVRDLRNAGLIDAEEYADTPIALADLQVVLEVLEGPAQLLHYFEWRRRWDEAEGLFDELDLLGVYITERNILRARDPDARINLTHASTVFEEFFVERWLNEEAEPPRMRLTGWWRDAIHALEQLRPESWSNLTSALLEFDYSAQRPFTRAANELVYRFRTGLNENPVESVAMRASGSPGIAIVAPTFLGSSTSNIEQIEAAVDDAGVRLEVEHLAVLARECATAAPFTVAAIVHVPRTGTQSPA